MEKKKNFTPIIVMLIVLSIVAIGFGVYNSKNCGVISDALGLAPSTGCVNPFNSVTLNVGDKVCIVSAGGIQTFTYFGACSRESSSTRTLIVPAFSFCGLASEILRAEGDLIACSNLCIDGGVQESTTMTATSCTVTRTRSCLPTRAGDAGGE
ncbi:hypothetical protein EXS72_02970 [Candidatus Pacearchaeota archaeon]|nr:hypothetical protein [Candidatus Pacearchaeota archaeon]